MYTTNRPNSQKIPETQPTYWYADFECDVSGDIHKPFMCAIHNQDGTIKEEFRGENCNKQLLDFAPDGTVIYFHNLAYDIRMVASFLLTIFFCEYCHKSFISIYISNAKYKKCNMI